MNITKVIAQPDGKFLVTFKGNSPKLMDTEGESAEQKALAAWFMDGGKAESFTPELVDLIASAKAEINEQASAIVLAIGGNPSPDEIASWPEKITASKAVLAGQDFDAVILASTMQDHGVNAQGAAQIILLRARLYRLAKAAAEIIANGTKQAIESAKDQATINTALEGFKAALGERQTQFTGLRADAIQGKLELLEAAEAEIIGN